MRQNEVAALEMAKKALVDFLKAYYTGAVALHCENAEKAVTAIDKVLAQPAHAHVIKIADRLSYYGACNDLGMGDNPTKQCMREASDEIRRQHYVLVDLKKAHDVKVKEADNLLEALKFVMTAHGEQLTTAFEQAQRVIEDAYNIKENI